MENQPKLSSSKEVIAFLAETFPACFCAEGEARPLKIGIFQDLVERVDRQMNISKTQLRVALRHYTSSWRYLHGIKPGVQRVDLDGNSCGVLDEQHVVHAQKQLEEGKARVQTRRAVQRQEKKRNQSKAAQVNSLSHNQNKSRPVAKPHQSGKSEKGRQPVESKVIHRPVSRVDIARLTPGQQVKVKVGNNETEVTVQEVAKEGVKVFLASGMSMFVRAEHLVF